MASGNLAAYRDGQRRRSFLRRAGIWYVDLGLGVGWAVAATAGWISGLSPVSSTIYTVISALMLGGAIPAYRQNRHDLLAARPAAPAEG